METTRMSGVPPGEDASSRREVADPVVLAARACEAARGQFEREVRRVEALRRTIDPEIRDWPGVPLIVEPHYDHAPGVLFARKVSQVMAHFEGPAGLPELGILAAAASEPDRQRLLANYRAAVTEVKSMNDRRRRAYRLAGMPFGPDPQEEQRYWRDWFDHVREGKRRLLSASQAARLA